MRAFGTFSPHTKIAQAAGFSITAKAKSSAHYQAKHLTTVGGIDTTNGTKA